VCIDACENTLTTNVRYFNQSNKQLSLYTKQNVYVKPIPNDHRTLLKYFFLNNRSRIGIVQSNDVRDHKRINNERRN
jgi:hypothetical protein